MTQKKPTARKSKSAKSAKPVRPVRPAKPARLAVNPFRDDPEHMGEMTVRQLVDLVSTDEFPQGLDTRICIGDVEGNLGVNATILVVAHRPEDVVLAIDEHGGDMTYGDGLDEEAMA